MQTEQQTHIIEVIEEAIYRRVKDTINEYIEKNTDAFAENQIAGVEWNLGLTVLVDNLGLNPQPKPKSLFKRFIQLINRFFSNYAKWR